MDAIDIAVLGSINLDLCFAVQRFPLAGETLMSSSLARTPGGKGLNQAVAAARMNRRVAMLGAVGAEEAGSSLRAFLGDNAVEIQGVATLAEAPTGIATIMLNDGGENMIVVAAGANQRISAEAVAAGMCDAGYYLAQLETPVPAIAAFFRAGRARGGKCVLNAAPALESARQLFPLCDVIVVNETELASFTGTVTDGPGNGAIGAAAHRMLCGENQTIIVTRGKQGVVAVRHGATLVVEARQVAATDTTGAGDCFCGVLVAGLSEGLALGAAIDRANAAAAIAVGRSGAATSSPTRTELDAFLASMPQRGGVRLQR